MFILLISEMDYICFQEAKVLIGRLCLVSIPSKSDLKCYSSPMITKRFVRPSLPLSTCWFHGRRYSYQQSLSKVEYI